jgi:hypothetical protein
LEYFYYGVKYEKHKPAGGNKRMDKSQDSYYKINGY